ncbi:MAG: hypothetical protein KDH09_14555 [Chrysiogenetes bacterium]|nr:hypothetical protein [Chrysiogenetes bacterium]
MDESADKGIFPAGARPDSDQAREEFDRFFGKVPPGTAEELAKSFEYAKSGTEESEIFERAAEQEEAPAPAVTPPSASAAAPEAPPRPIVRVPGANDIEPLDFHQATRLLEEATQVYEVSDALLGYARGMFGRAALFVSRAPWLEGWDAVGGGWSRGMIRKLEISLEEPSIFGIFQRGAGYYLGPIPKTPANDEFVRITGGKRPRNCLIVPILIGNRIVNLLYADNGHASELAADFSQIMPVLQTVGKAYERLIRSGD